MAKTTKKQQENTDEKKILTRITHEMWQKLRKISYEKEISVNELTRMGIQRIINKYEK